MDSIFFLLELAKKGNREAIEKLVVHFETLIQRECAKFDLDAHQDLSQSDLVQEVSFRVVERFYQFSGDRAQHDQITAFCGWLRKTARTTVLNILKQQSNSYRKPAAGIVPLGGNENGLPKRSPKTASSIVSKDEEKWRLKLAMKQLENQNRKIVRMKIVDGLTYAAIGEQLNLTNDQVRYRFELALKKLERILSS